MSINGFREARIESFSPPNFQWFGSCRTCPFSSSSYEWCESGEVAIRGAQGGQREGSAAKQDEKGGVTRDAVQWLEGDSLLAMTLILVRRKAGRHAIN